MDKCKHCGYDEERHNAPVGKSTGTALCPGFEVASNTPLAALVHDILEHNGRATDDNAVKYRVRAIQAATLEEVEGLLRNLEDDGWDDDALEPLREVLR